MRQTTILLALATMTLGGCSWFQTTPAKQPELVHEAPATNAGGGGGPAMTRMAPSDTPATMAATGPGEKPRIDDPTTLPAESYHLIIAAYSTRDIGKAPENATAAAKYLTDHGVPVMVTLPSAAGKPALIVSSQGFASPKDGADLLAKVTATGKTYPGAKGKPAFADAYFKKIKK